MKFERDECHIVSIMLAMDRSYTPQEVLDLLLTYNKFFEANGFNIIFEANKINEGVEH